MRHFDAALARALCGAMRCFGTTGSAAELIAYCDRALAAAGGRLFDGFVLGGE